MRDETVVVVVVVVRVRGMRYECSVGGLVGCAVTLNSLDSHF